MDALYGEFISIQLSVLPDYGELIPGIGEAITTIQERGIAVAGRGYDREMMSIVVEEMAEQGVRLGAAIGAWQFASARWLDCGGVNCYNEV